MNTVKIFKALKRAEDCMDKARVALYHGDKKSALRHIADSDMHRARVVDLVNKILP